MNDQNSVENDSKEESYEMSDNTKNVTLKRTLNKSNSSPNNTKLASPPRSDIYKKAI